MASAYKNIAGTINYTTDTNLYTCPAATVGIVKNISVHNTHTGSVVTYLKFFPAAFASAFILFKLTFPAGATSTLPPLIGNGTLVGPYVCEAGDKLQINCDVAEKITVFANVLEIS
tara:strand:+ start:136 stop:483 length:348 start_codon:yes stop_codon:yes gene_type:complete